MHWHSLSPKFKVSNIFVAQSISGLFYRHFVLCMNSKRKIPHIPLKHWPKDFLSVLKIITKYSTGSCSLLGIRFLSMGILEKREREKKSLEIYIVSFFPVSVWHSVLCANQIGKSASDNVRSKSLNHSHVHYVHNIYCNNR